jgi:hypothetical protein
MPAWLTLLLAVLQALATPVLAAVGLFIAYQQKRQGDIALQIQRFEKRYAIFASAKKLLATVQRDAYVSTPDILSYSYEIGDAVFLTNDDVVKYLRLLQEKAAKLGHYRSMYEMHDESHQKRLDENHELILWFNAQYDVLVNKFKPILSLGPAR